MNYNFFAFITSMSEIRSRNEINISLEIKKNIDDKKIFTTFEPSVVKEIEKNISMFNNIIIISVFKLHNSFLLENVKIYKSMQQDTSKYWIIFINKI